MTRAILLSLIIFATLPIGRAAAQDEPYFDRPGAKAPAAGVREEGQREGFRFQINAEAGYTYLHKTALDTLDIHGPTVGGSLTATWETSPFRVGGQLRAYGTAWMQGEMAPFFSENEGPGEAKMWGVSLAAVAYWTPLDLWFGLGVGLSHGSDFVFQAGGNPDPDHTVEMDDDWIPEIIGQLGYDLALSRHVGIRLSAEVGTMWLLSWRVSGFGGVVVRI